MELYSFFNSSTSYRVRIALALKGIDITYQGVNIRAGEQRATDFVEQVNASASVPAIVEGDFRLGQSLAIIDWLDGQYPEPRLIPEDGELRARVLELSSAIACDIHPLNNLRVLGYLQQTLGVTPEQKDAWYQHWINEGMAVVERLLANSSRQYGGPWAFGASPTLADCCLIPQMANALRMGCDLTPFTRAMEIYQHAGPHPAFLQAEPKNQPDHIS